MISWIQRTFQRHMRLMFVLLLIAVIIPFVFVIGAQPGVGRAERSITHRPFFGLNLASQEDQQKLMGDAAMSVSLQMGYMGAETAQLQNYALQRRAALHLANELGVPAPSTDELTEFVKTLRAFSGNDGQFDPTQYARFRDSLKTNPRGANEGDVSRVISDDWRVDRVQKLLGGPGYVLPADVKTQLTRAESTWTLNVATADYASFNPEIKPTEADLTKYFEENSFRYEIPARVSASYVEFPATNYVGQVTLTDDEVKAYYDANPSRFPKPFTATLGTDTKVDPAADFALVRPQVEAAVRLERAQRLASKAAADFSFELYERKIATIAEAEALVAQNKLTVKPLAPFTREAGPTELSTGAQEAAAAAFKLDASRIFSDAINTPTGAVVLFWRETQPARKPLFVEVREKVSVDYVENEKRKRFVELGKTLRAQLEARLKAGDAFDKTVATVASNAGVKLEAKTLSPFTRRQPPQDLDYTIMGSLDQLEKGEVSDMIVGADKGYLVHAADKQLPDLSETNPSYASTRTQLASLASRVNASAYLTELVTTELKKSEPVAATP